jgi:hypothetical protein
MANARLGLGTLVKYDHDDDASYTTIGEISAVDPPPREYEAVDATDLADVLQVSLQGIEQSSTWEFTQIYTDGDTVHEYIDSAFGSKHNYSWQIIFAADSGGGAARTWQFTSRIMAIGHETVDASSVCSRVITLQRTSAITRS